MNETRRREIGARIIGYDGMDRLDEKLARMVTEPTSPEEVTAIEEIFARRLGSTGGLHWSGLSSADEYSALPVEVRAVFARGHKSQSGLSSSQQRSLRILERGARTRSVNCG